ncbi:hypothetical protein DFH09DRAFT_1316802 [Mycena vulgaris]|nr:hypothetical protein DFH09DRAFT_1329643 [Mycena vulgaris]KAJ6559496.1 hypothetical protein DFH09DRAFT_1316802 [Mycena vulgaris]
MALNTGGTYFSRSLAALDRLGNMDEEATLAQVALARFTPGDRMRVENFLALADHEPTGPPQRRGRRPSNLKAASTAVSARGGVAMGGSRVVPTAAGSSSRPRVVKRLLICWLTNDASPVQAMVSMDSGMAWLSKNEEALSQMGLATGAQVEVYSKKKKWVAIAWNSPIQPLPGVPVLLLRLKGVTRQGEWDEYTAQYFK